MTACTCVLCAGALPGACALLIPAGSASLAATASPSGAIATLVPGPSELFDAACVKASLVRYAGGEVVTTGKGYVGVLVRIEDGTLQSVRQVTGMYSELFGIACPTSSTCYGLQETLKPGGPGSRLRSTCH